MSGHPIGIRGGDWGRDLRSYHPPEQPYNWYTKDVTGTQPAVVLTRDAQIRMLHHELGIDESNILEPNDSERIREDKWRSSSHRDLLRELDLANWEPDRLGWSRRRRVKEAESEWIQRFYSHLFLRVNGFVTDNFGRSNIPPGTRSVWASRDFSKHFVHYAQLVARQDNYCGGWDWVLVTARQRAYLVLGIIGKMLQTHVFDDLLFGGAESDKAILQSQDEGLITLEGKILHVFKRYQRTDLRGRSVKAILGQYNLPEQFWEAVDVLTMKMATTLLPLIDLQDEYFPEFKEVSLRGIYQDLHYIVAEAGFFSLTLRESKDIFRFTWPFPGQSWDREQANYDDELYRQSLEQNERFREEQQRQYEEALQQAQGEEEQHPDEDEAEEEQHPDADEAEAGQHPDQGEQEEDDASSLYATPLGSPAILAKRFQILGSIKKRLKKTRPLPAPPAPSSQIAKVHICLWPMLQRFSNPTPPWEPPHTYPPEEEVERGAQYVTTIARARVVYYLGSTDEEAEQAERVPSLAEHIAAHRRRGWLSLPRLLPGTSGVSRAGRVALLGLGLMALLAGAACLFPFVLSLLRGIPEALMRAVDKVVWAVNWVGSGALRFLVAAVKKFFFGLFMVVHWIEQGIGRVFAYGLRELLDAYIPRPEPTVMTLPTPPVRHRGWSWTR